MPELHDTRDALAASTSSPLRHEGMAIHFGALTGLPQRVLALGMSFVSGAIFMNGAVVASPSEKNGSFLPLMSGRLVNGSTLVPFG